MGSGLAPTNRPRRQTRAAAKQMSELTLIDVHDRAVTTVNTIGEPETLVEAASRLIWLVHSDLHRVSSSSAGFVKRRLHKSTAKPMSAAVRNDVQLREVALEATAPNGHPESQNNYPVWSVAAEEDDRVTFKEGLEALRQDFRRWTWLAELIVEAVQQSTDFADIIHVGNSDWVS